MRLSLYAKDIFAELSAAKRISKLSFDETELERALQYIDYVNNMVTDYAAVIDDVANTDTFAIPSHLKGLFYPSRVVQDPTRESLQVNLLLKDGGCIWPIKTARGTDYNYDDFRRFVTQLYAAYRLSPTFDTKLSDIRVIDQVDNVVSRMMRNSSTLMSVNHTALPVSLSCEYWSEFAYTMPSRDYILVMIRNILNSIIS